MTIDGKSSQNPRPRDNDYPYGTLTDTLTDIPLGHCILVFGEFSLWVPDIESFSSQDFLFLPLKPGLSAAGSLSLFKS